MDRNKAINRVGLIGIVANLFLFIIKIIVAVISNSQGLIADSINSGSDIFSSLMTYIGSKLSGAPEDREHPDGHGKVEYVFTLIISLVMGFLAVTILINSIKAIVEKQVVNFTWNLVLICGITIITKLILYLYTSKLGKKYSSLLIIANSEDHRNDMFLTFATLVGIIASAFNIYFLDGIAGIVISIWIFVVAMKLFVGAYDVLIDTDISDNLKEKIENIILNDNRCTIDSLKAKPIGINYILLLEISIESTYSFLESHDIAEEIKEKIKQIPSIVDVYVHVNPKENSLEISN